MTAMDIHQRDDLAFPQSLPEFQKLFPMTPRARPILDALDGLVVLSVRIAV